MSHVIVSSTVVSNFLYSNCFLFERNRVPVLPLNIGNISIMFEQVTNHAAFLLLLSFSPIIE